MLNDKYYIVEYLGGPNRDEIKKQRFNTKELAIEHIREQEWNISHHLYEITINTGSFGYDSKEEYFLGAYNCKYDFNERERLVKKLATIEEEIKEVKTNSKMSESIKSRKLESLEIQKECTTVSIKAIDRCN